MYYYNFVNDKIKFQIIADSKNLRYINFKEVKNEDLIYKKTDLISETIKQLNEYFTGDRKEFNIPMLILGTDFQKKVWIELTKIPYGETVSYKYIAEKINNNKAYRAVGLANNKNPLSIIIPCHRVIGENGKLVGYGGGLDIKTMLLEHEKGHK